MSSYYKEILEKIKNDISSKDFFSAYAKIENELSMPYIPRNFEEQFNELKVQVLPFVAKSKSVSLTFEKAREMILSEEPEKRLIAINFLREQNLRRHKDKIKEIIEDYLKGHNDIVTLLFELLVEQEVNIDICLPRGIVNPSDFDSVFPYEQIEEASKMTHELFFQEPNKAQLAIDLMQKFVLYFFPLQEIDLTKNVEKIGNIVKSIFSPQPLLDAQESELKEILFS